MKISKPVYKTILMPGKALLPATVILMVSIILLCLCSCQNVDPNVGYTTQSLYPANVQTVYVEMFHSKTFRRQVEYKLTRAFIDQLELHSNIKVLPDRSRADTIIYGTVDTTERVLTQHRKLDRPLENQIVLIATVTWKDLRNGKFLINNQKIKVSGDYIPLLAASSETAIQQAAEKMAVRITEAMQKPW